MFTGDATKNNWLKIISKILAVCRSLPLSTVLGLEPSRSVRGGFNEGCTLSIGVSADSPKITHAYISETQLLPAFASRTGCLLLWAGQWRSTYLSQAESLTKPQCFSKPNNLFTREPWQVLMGGLSGLLAVQRKINDQRRSICHDREASDFHLCWRFASRRRWRQTASSQLFLQGHRNSTDMNQSQITSLMAAAPVPPQFLCCGFTVCCSKAAKVTNFVFASAGAVETRRGSHSSQNKLPCHRVQQNKANVVFLGLFLFPGGCVCLLLDTFHSVFIYTRDKTCIISAASQHQKTEPSAGLQLLLTSQWRKPEGTLKTTRSVGFRQ